jgi:hypothetical protein
MDPRERLSAHNAVVATSIRRGAEQYLADLKAKLAISRDQTDAWERFAASLRANRGRMETSEDAAGQPFGRLADRRTALDTMRQAATELFALLGPAQQRAASRVLPLCCLPHRASLEVGTAVPPEQEAVAIADLVEELKRNATYYSAGPDRDAGDLLWRAARALAGHSEELMRDAPRRLRHDEYI